MPDGNTYNYQSAVYFFMNVHVVKVIIDDGRCRLDSGCDPFGEKRTNGWLDALDYWRLVVGQDQVLAADLFIDDVLFIQAMKNYDIYRHRLALVDLENPEIEDEFSKQLHDENIALAMFPQFLEALLDKKLVPQDFFKVQLEILANMEP